MYIITPEAQMEITKMRETIADLHDLLEWEKLGHNDRMAVHHAVQVLEGLVKQHDDFVAGQTSGGEAGWTKRGGLGDYIS